MRNAALLHPDIERAVDERLNQLVRGATVLGPATPIAIKAFTGREWDPETGLYYYRARYYDPKAGRFISRDPLGLRAGVNAYDYTTGNPISRRDPSGKDWRDGLKGLAKGAAAVGLTAFALAQLGIDIPADVAAIAAIVATTKYIKDQLDPSIDSDTKDELAGEFYGGVMTGAFCSATRPDYGSTPNGRSFTRHYGTERGPVRNIPGTVVDNTIDYFEGVPVPGGKTVYYDPANDVTVVTGQKGIVSARRGPPRPGQK